VFNKRRKFDERQAPPASAPVDPSAPKLRPSATEPAPPVEAVSESTEPAATEAPLRLPSLSSASMTPPYPPGMLSKPAENGLGVPPFRAASPKDQPMGRTPFASSPSAPPATTPAVIPSNPIRPASLPTSMARALPSADPAERRTLVVGRGISVQGVVQDAERLVVEGTVEATMIHATELAISHGGVFKGEAEVEEAEVAGTIDGTLTARSSLIIRSTGKVIGTARCRRLQVEDGGQISGKMEMLTEAPKPAEAVA